MSTVETLYFAATSSRVTRPSSISGANAGAGGHGLLAIDVCVQRDELLSTALESSAQRRRRDRVRWPGKRETCGSLK